MNALLKELKPYFLKGLTDKEIARTVRKPVGTIMLYRAEYEKDLFSKIKPINDDALNEIKSEIAAVDYIEGSALIDKEIENTYAPKEEKVTKKDIAFELFAKGMSVEEIMEVAGLSYNSVVTYRTQYNKTLKVAENVTPVKEEDVLIHTGTINFKVGNAEFNADTFVDNEGCEWVDSSMFKTTLKAELQIDIKSITIAEKYIKIANNLLLIDKFALPILARSVKDFKLTNSIMNLIEPRKDIFSKAYTISQAFSNVEELLSAIDGVYEQIQAYDKAQQDILHDIEKYDYSSEVLTKKAIAIRDLRRARRVSKNELALIKNIKNSLNGYKIKPYMIRETGSRLSTLMDDLYNKKYNPRVAELNELQKESVDKYIY